MKKYKLEILIDEGNDEFWNEFKEKSGCDEVTEAIQLMLSDSGFVNANVKLIEYSNK